MHAAMIRLPPTTVFDLGAHGRELASERAREMETETERQRDRETDTDTESDRHRDTDTETYRQRQRERERESMRRWKRRGGAVPDALAQEHVRERHAPQRLRREHYRGLRARHRPLVVPDPTSVPDSDYQYPTSVPDSDYQYQQVEHEVPA
eukprot:2843667-Rhodomonas_salina.1